NAPVADQPGGSVTTDPNTTTTQVHYHNGVLVTAMGSAAAADGFTYPKGRIYQISVSGAPVLLHERLIDPGTGVAVQQVSADQDILGNLGVTWMESSKNEFVSMWVGIIDTGGNLSATVAAPGGGFMPASGRIGDYSTTVLDPGDGKTFWSANEFIGTAGGSDIWRTHITNFGSSTFVAGP